MLCFIPACIWPKHILHFTEELRDRHCHCRFDLDDRRGGGHHDPGVKEEAQEPLHHRLLHLLRPLHQHCLQPQQHEQVFILFPNSSGQKFTRAYFQEKLRRGQQSETSLESETSPLSVTFHFNLKCLRKLVVTTPVSVSQVNLPILEATQCNGATSEDL